jgi:hypothetical protein
VKGTQVLWFDAIGRIPVRIGIPIELTAPISHQRLRSYFSRTLKAVGALCRSTCHSILAPFSFDHPVRPRQHVGRDREADLLGCLQIDNQLKFRWLLHGQVGRLGTS